MKGGVVDWSKAASVLAQKGDVNAIGDLAPMIWQQMALSAGDNSPFIGSPQSNPSAGSGSASTVPASQVTPATATGGDQPGSIVDIVTAKLPQNSQQTGAVIGKIAQNLGVDPNVTLTPGQQRRAQGLFDRYSQGGAATGENAPLVPPTAPVAAPGAPAALPNARSGAGTISGLVAAKFPEDSAAPDRLVPQIAQTLGVDPNAPLTLGQQRRAEGLLNRYVAQSSGSAASAPLVSGGSRALSPDAAFGGPPPSPAGRVADGFTALPPSAGAVEPAPTPAARNGVAQTQGMPAVSPRPAVAAPGGGAPQVARPQVARPQVARPQAQPLVPQYPLPINPRTKKPYDTPQEAVQAYDNEIMRLSRIPGTGPQVKVLEAERARIEAQSTPMKVGPYETYVDPRTNRPIYQGPLAGGAALPQGETLDAGAEMFYQTGKLPPNTGRGVQGASIAQAYMRRAAELHPDDPVENWPPRWQQFHAQGVGLGAGERTRATREENLKLILRAADAAIPAALEQSEKVGRTGWVPLNKIIQAGQVMASDPELRAFGMANLQLAEHWARAMNPTGVMRESDRDKALGFLSTADLPATYRRLVMQLKTQIERELAAVQATKAGASPQPGDQSAAAPGGGATSAPSGNAPRISTKAEYDALSPGSPYIAPDGSVRTKQQ